MTITHELLGDAVDALPVEQTTDLDEVRSAVLRREQEAQKEGEEEASVVLAWERGIIDLNVPETPHYSLFRGAAYEQYAEFYGFTDETLEYARRRATETTNPLLRVHHLEYVLARGPQTGREWFNVQRQLAEAYRTLVDHTLALITGRPGDHGALYIARWVGRIAGLINRKGILRAEEPADWAEWIIGVGEALYAIDWELDDGIQMQHRWPYEILEHLAAIPADAIAPGLRERALRLVGDAFEHYSQEPLADTFVSRTAEVEAALRKHFGEQDTHRTMVRRQYEALLRAARFHREHGSGLVAQHFFREARKLVEGQRQYFGEEDVNETQRAEREALRTAVDGGEFKQVTAGQVEIKLDDFDERRDDAAATVQGLIAGADHRIPSYDRIRASAKQTMQEHPLQFLFGASTIDGEKVVGEAHTEDQHLARQVEQQMKLEAQFVGLVYHVTLVRAYSDGQITADDVVKELGRLALPKDEVQILKRGIKRYLEEDFISAGHILAPQFENILRRMFSRVGVETTEFRRLPDGSTRTDDATLGTLLYSKTDDGRAVKELLGTDSWEFIRVTMASTTGMNLRNKFAHGLATKAECKGPIVGIILHHIFWLASLEVVAVNGGSVPDAKNATPAVDGNDEDSADDEAAQ